MMIDLHCSAIALPRGVGLNPARFPILNLKDIVQQGTFVIFDTDRLNFDIGILKF